MTGSRARSNYVNINIKEPSTVLAILLITGMIVGPWFVHDRALTRSEFRLAQLEEKVQLLHARMTGAETTLAERKQGFLEAINVLKRQQLPNWVPPEPVEPEKH